MKQSKNELDVDSIGGSGPLTKEEEKAISEYIKSSKERKQKQQVRKKKRGVITSIDMSGATS
ncbi:hypothetical protein BH11BAC3_BH11BAC3_29420 [soil metagenome]